MKSAGEAAQKQLVEKERLLRDTLNGEDPTDRLSAQQAVQEQVIEKVGLKPWQTLGF